jgi:hypothetical protein
MYLININYLVGHLDQSYAVVPHRELLPAAKLNSVTETYVIIDSKLIEEISPPYKFKAYFIINLNLPEV